MDSRQRSIFYRFGALLWLGVLAACRAAPVSVAPVTSTLPNILLVTFDTTRADRIGCYGFPLARTPAVDRLAREGVRFADHVTVAPITLPAHASILTGLNPPAHGVRDNGAYALGDEVITLAERLKPLGYETHAFVSAAVLDRRYNLTQGFDTYDDELWAEDDPALFMIRDRPAPRTASRVLTWLETWSAKRRPFFTWVHFFDPHQPYQPHTRQGYLVPTPYDAEIASADEGLASILARLEQLQVLDNTVAVMTADHGESLDEHGEKTHGLFVYDATMRVPWVMRFPPQIPQGVVYQGPSRAVDLMPTLLALVGAPEAPAIDGVSLLASIRGESKWPALPQYHESLLAETGFGMAPLFAMREKGFKYIRAPRPELYDLAADPKETANIVAALPDVAATMSRDLDALLASSEAHAKPASVQVLDGETAEMLQALGYLAPAATRAAMTQKTASPSTTCLRRHGMPASAATGRAQWIVRKPRWRCRPTT